MNVQITQAQMTNTNLKQNGEYRPYIIADDREREVHPRCNYSRARACDRLSCHRQAHHRNQLWHESNKRRIGEF